MTPLRSLRARLLAPAGVASLALLAIASFGGCFVSFDSYQLGSSGVSGQLSVSTSAGTESRGAAPNSHGAGGNSTATSRGGSADIDADPAGANSVAGADTAHGGRAGSGSGSAGLGGVNTGSGGSVSRGGESSRGGSVSRGGESSGGAGLTAGVGGRNSAGAGGTGQYTCPTIHGRISVEIPRSGSPSIYCIDRAEVKNAEYQAFLDAGVSTSLQSAACAFNVNFGPDTAGGCNQYDPVGKANVPVACVDWCDAAAYCKWEGKHLCGRVDGLGSNPPAAFADANQSAWYRACSHAGDFDLPYGNSYDGEKCIGLDNTAVHPVAVPHTDCEGGYSGLYDMSGNVAEWEDSCSADASAADQCLTRGGSYLDTNRSVGSAPSLLCNSNVHGMPIAATKPRSTRDKEIGFRCCGDPVFGP